MDVGRDEVTIKAGKQANKRTLTFALQALVAVFGENNANLFVVYHLIMTVSILCLYQCLLIRLS